MHGSSRRTWRLLQAAVLLCALTGLAALSIWSWRRVPQVSTLARLRIGSGQTILLAPDDQPDDDWVVHLNFDRRVRQHGDWILTIDAETVQHQMCWLSDRRMLRIRRFGQGLSTRSPATTLAVLVLPQQPQHIAVRDHPAGLELIIDHSSQIIVDPLPAFQPRRWDMAVADGGSLERSIISVQFTSDRPPTSELTPALSRLRMMAVDDKPQYVDEALAAIRALGDHHPHHNILQAWWSALMSRQALDAQLDDSDISDHLTALLAIDTNSSAALASALLPSLAAWACAVPEQPKPPRPWLEARLGRIDLLLETIAAITRRPDVLDDYEQQELLLLRHAARRLVGRPGSPVPADAPPWMTLRWRLLSGSILSSSELTAAVDGEIPTLPQPWTGRPITRDTFRTLWAAHAIDDVHLRQTGALIRHHVTDREPALAVHALQRLPERQRAIAATLLAFRGLIPPDEAQQALAMRLPDGPPLHAVDPLAHALSRLLAKRHPAVGFLPRIMPDLPGPEAEFDGPLRPYHELLRGTLAAPMLVFVEPGSRLPLGQALTAALAMQEVAGLQPDWQMLDLLAPTALPLELCRPAEP